LAKSQNWRNYFLILRHQFLQQKDYSISGRIHQPGAGPMTDRPQPTAARRVSLSLDTWALLAASLFILAVVFGSLPRIPW
jgi:hypothetical protein